MLLYFLWNKISALESRICLTVLTTHRTINDDQDTAKSVTRIVVIVVRIRSHALIENFVKSGLKSESLFV